MSDVRRCASCIAKLPREGEFAQKSLFCKRWLIAWSHATRFLVPRRLIAPHAGARLLDCSCGDGTLIAMVHHLVSESVRADIAQDAAMMLAVYERALA